MPSGRVLIVDDDDDIREATQDALERRGFEVIAVESGSEALAYLSHDTPDIMLLDLQMDDMNGWEVLGSLQRQSQFASMRVIVVTGSGATLPRSIHVLRKPFKIDALVALIEGQAAGPSKSVSA